MAVESNSDKQVIISDKDGKVKLKAGSVIINKKATKKHWKKLSEINQSAGGGVPIVPPSVVEGENLHPSLKDKVTTDGSKGGMLDGKPHYDENGNSLGGIKAVVVDGGGKQVELEAEEAVINPEAVKEHWEELSEINQSAGNGVPILPPADVYDEDPVGAFGEGGNIIEFNANDLPNKWIVNYAKFIKKNHPEIWKLAGNIFGNEAFINLERVRKRGYWLDSEEWMYIKWKSYVARHKKDFRLAGVIAMLKWCDKVDKGWAYMKNMIEAEITRQEKKEALKSKKKVATAKKKPKSTEKEFGYVKLNLGFKEKDWELLLSTIDKEDLYFDEDGKKGLSHEPHVTILYGLHKEVKDKQVSEILKEANCPEVEFTKVSIFDNENYDVLKFDVKSNELVELNKEFRKLPHTNNFPDYHPHCTIAYFKKGKAKKYIDLIEVPKEIPCKDFQYCKFDDTEITYEIKESKFEEGGNIKSENALEQIIELTKANRDEWIAEIKEKAIEKGEPLEKRDIEYLEWSLIADLMKAIGKYIKPSDKLIEVKFIDFNKVQIIATVERDGKEHSFSTDFIPAGGHTIQHFHFRYIVKTTLGAVSSNPFYDKFKEKLKSLNKLQRLDKDAERVNGLIERYKSDLAETNRRMSLSELELEKEARVFDKDRGDDSWKMVDLTYEQLNDNYKAQGQILERTKEEHEASTEEYRQHKLDFYKYRKGKPSVTQNRIKELLKEKAKVEAKIQAETENLEKFEDGGNLNPKDSVNLDIPLMIRLLELAREDIKSDKELHDVAERLIDLRDKEVLTMEDYDFIAGIKENSKYKELESNPKYEKGANIETLLAPNGQPTKLTPEQYKLVRTPEFKSWFGDWENNPEDSSKVVDSNGEPLVCYHGTKKFERFNQFKKGSKGYLGGGIYFTSDKDKASSYAQYGNDYINQYDCFLNMRNPFNVEGSIGTDDLLTKLYGNPNVYKKRSSKQSFDTMIVKSSDINKLLDKGYDGIYWDLADEYIVYESTQIKLADGTNTTFKRFNPDIRFEDGGSVNNGLLAPNGEPSNLTPEQYNLVRTTEFKAWFGDWENAPMTSSKVVDANGEPLVCYHGSDKIFTEFKNVNPKAGYKAQYWFTPSKEFAEMYPESDNKKVYECFINIKNPSSTYPIPETRVYDGFIDFKTEMDYTTFTQKKEITIVQATESNQIKLADGTNTTFEPTSNDIRFEEGGLIDFSKESIRKYAENILKDFDYEYVGYSDTNGHSMYFKVDDVKIRFSDHSVTNVDRMNNEVHFNLWDGRKAGTPYGDFIINQKILCLKYDLGDKNIIYHKRPMMMPSGKVLDAFGYSEKSDISFEDGGNIESTKKRINDLLTKAQIPYQYTISHKNGSSYWTIKSRPYRVSDHDKPKSMDVFERYKLGINDFRSYEEFLEFLVNNLDLTDLSEEEAKYKTSVTSNIKLDKDDYITPDGRRWVDLDSALNYLWKYQLEKRNIYKPTSYLYELEANDLNSEFYKKGGNVATTLLAPNGQPSNLTPELYNLVRTAEFKSWFGDWESDSKNASKIVDANGEPMVVFHGSRSNFTVFDKTQAGKSNSIARIGFWFSPIESFARNFVDDAWYGGNQETTVYPVFLSIKNPKIYTTTQVPKEAITNLNDKIKTLRENNKKISNKWTYNYEERQAFTYAMADSLNAKNRDYYANRTPRSKEAILDGYEVAKTNMLISDLEEQYWELVYSDSYQKLSTDIYSFENKTAKDANVGGLGMMLDNVVKTTDKYVESLKEQGFDGIIVEKTRFDQAFADGLNDQFVVFEPEQIKLADGTNTTFDTTNPDIRFEDGGLVSSDKERAKCINEVLKQKLAEYETKNQYDDLWFEVRTLSRQLDAFLEVGKFTMTRDEFKIFKNSFFPLDNDKDKYFRGKEVTQQFPNLMKLNIRIWEAIGDGLLYRGVSLVDWERIKKQGYIDSDMRSAVTEHEGINLGQSVEVASTYLPSDNDGVILEIKTNGLNMYILTDDYIRVFQPIPIENVIKVSSPISKDKLGTLLFDDTNKKLNEIENWLKEHSIQINCNPDIRFEVGGSVRATNSRFKPTETINFNPPLVGKNGNKLVAYTWKYEYGLAVKDGEDISKRFSDWSQAETSAETGRDIVHVFDIMDTEGKITSVSSESVPVALGFITLDQKKTFSNLATASKTLAKQQLQLAILKAEHEEWKKVRQEIIDAGYPEITYHDSTHYNDGDDVIMRMGDAKCQGYKSNPNDPERIQCVTDGYIGKEMEKRGKDKYFPTYKFYDLEQRIKRQEKKVQNIIKSNEA